MFVTSSVNFFAVRIGFQNAISPSCTTPGYRNPVCRLDCCSSAKPRAVACYASQLRALGSPGHVPIEQAFAPEQYWRVRAGA